jgi:hypothetical protein
MSIVQILLLSEVFLSKDFLDSALSKLNIPCQVTMTGSINEALPKNKIDSFKIFITDTYMIETIPEILTLQMIRLNARISFILISYSLDEKSILNWFDIGFTDVVLYNNPLSLALSIKREIRNYERVAEK